MQKASWLLVLVGFTAILAVTRAGATEEVIYSMGGDEDGEYTDTDLVLDSAGNIYGTSVQGGDFGTGTVFQLSPSGSTWTHTVLYDFKGSTDGGQPYKGVTLDAAGNLYGTTVIGGTFGGACPEDGCGVVYRLSKSGGQWRQTVIYAFKGGNDGYEPGAGVTFDAEGNLYGMTPLGGPYGAGVIYQLHPQGNSWVEHIVHAFTGGNDGGFGSAGRLILDEAGNLYGVTTAGGANGQGTAFELQRNASGKFKLITLYAFKGQPDAGFPYGGLYRDSAGNLFGTTYYDGANDLGAVYELVHGSGNNWKEHVLYSFKGGSDGNGSIGNLVSDAAGNLYGTTSEGGASCSCGTIFKMTPTGNGKWSESIAYRFTGTPDAGFAYNGMTPDGSGSFVGATVHGGSDDEGAIYRFTP